MRSFVAFSILGFLSIACVYLVVERLEYLASEHSKYESVSDVFLFAATTFVSSIFVFTTCSMIRSCCHQANERVMPQIIGQIEQIIADEV